MKWDSRIKEKIAYIIAGVAAAVGFGLTIAGFIVAPTGEVHSSVQWILGETLVFTASVLGISLYARNTINSMRDEIGSYIDSHLKAQRQREGDDIT